MPKGQFRYKLDDTIGNPNDWTLTFAINDDASFETQCEFCRQGEQRISYEVRRGPERRWICQRCLGRYDIAGEIDGIAVGRTDARDRLHGLSIRLKQDSARRIISAINRDMNDFAMDEAAAYFERNVLLSPRHAAVVFAAISALGIQADVRIFEVQTRSKACQDEFGRLVRVDRAMIWPALSPQQQRRLSFLGHAPYASPRKTSKRRSAIVDRASHYI